MNTAALLQAHPDMVVCRNAEQRITQVNSAFLQHFGGNKDSWLGKMFEPVACGAQIGAFFEDRMYGHLSTETGDYWVEWIEVPLIDGETMACGRVNPDRRQEMGRAPQGVERRKNHIVHKTHDMQAGPSAGMPDKVETKPAPAPVPPVTPMTRPIPPARAATRILLAEDDMLNAKLAMALLENEGCHVTHAMDGRAALAEAQKGAFDMVFMDMRMPEMDGLQATRAIRQLGGEWLQIPIIALTANAFSTDKQACREAGMNGFLTKPITVDGLLAAKRHWTNKAKQAKTG